MKKATLVLAAVAAISFIFALSSCATTNSSGSSGSSQGGSNKQGEKVTIKMYDNCPTDDAGGILAQAGIKALDSSYTGESSFSFVGTPDASSIQPILKFTSSCRAIQAAIQKTSGKKCTLTYNTAKDGSGITLDLSSTTAILNTLAMMISKNATTIYGIYKY
ncbi:MAG: hypothetical protein J6X11_06680 [Treponema sp.]|nr:hypothetical protein [Treponema sp.]MBP5748508.1 hypothetical protein [Treponema sp.]